MLNQFVVAGRLVADPEVKTYGNGNSYANFTIAVPRSYKNVDGVYDTDFIDIVTFGSISQNTAEYCKKGDIIGVKGRLETSVYEDEFGEKKKTTSVIAEKVSFLSSKRKEDDNVKESDDDLDM